MRADFHIHTNFSSDAPQESCPKSMIEGAIAKGLEVICITDHMDPDYDETNEMFCLPTEEYVREIAVLREVYRGRIDVRTGVEFGMQPHLGIVAKEYVNAFPFDYVIGSAHVLHGKDPYYRDNFATWSDQRLYAEMFEEMYKSLQNIDDFDVLGHLDYIVRYGYEQEKSYSLQEHAEILDEILKHLVAHGKGLEVNTAGLKYGLPFAHPHPQLLKRYRELGGEIITVGSDGHKVEHLAYDFHLVKEFLRQAGFRYYAEFSERKPVFQELG